MSVKKMMAHNRGSKAHDYNYYCTSNNSIPKLQAEHQYYSLYFTELIYIQNTLIKLQLNCLIGIHLSNPNIMNLDMHTLLQPFFLVSHTQVL